MAFEDWFETAVSAYVTVEVAKANQQPVFAPPYQPTTYSTQPNASAFDMKNLGGGLVTNEAGEISPLFMAAMLGLLGLVIYKAVN